MIPATLTGAPAPSIAFEPSLDDILADPLVRLILRRDGLSVNAVRDGFERARRHLAARSLAA